MDYSRTGSCVHGILQARILEWEFPSLGDLPNPGIESRCPALQAGFFYRLSHQGSLGILAWVAYPFSRGYTPPRNPTGVSCIVGWFFTSWVFPGSALCKYRMVLACSWLGTTKTRGSPSGPWLPLLMPFPPAPPPRLPLGSIMLDSLFFLSTWFLPLLLVSPDLSNRSFLLVKIIYIFLHSFQMPS